MAKKSTITVRLGKSNEIKETNQIRTPIYLECEGHTYPGMIVHHLDHNNIFFRWYRVPKKFLTHTPDYRKMYLKHYNALPA